MKQTIETKVVHTAGPWKLGKAGHDRAVYGPRGEHVATCPDMLMAGEVLANARLIAAAPELLAALEGARKALRKALPFLRAEEEAVFCGEWLDEINSAIAKAKGGAE